MLAGANVQADINAKVLDEVTAATERSTEAFTPQVTIVETLTEKTKRLAEEAEAYVAAAKAEAEASKEAAEALVGQAEALMGVGDATWAARIANREWEETLLTGEEKLAKLVLGGADWLIELKKQTDSATGAADAQAELNEELAAAEGKTISAADALDTWNRTVLDSARSASGPLKASLIEAIALKNGLTTNEVMEVLAIADADVAAARLAELSEPREMLITADANTAAADEKIRVSTLPRVVDITARVHPQNVPQYNNVYVPLPPNTNYVPGANFAEGTLRAPGGRTLVGERGPEIVDLPAGSRVRNNMETESMMQPERLPVTVQITGNIYGVPDDSFVAELAGRLNKYMAGMA